MLDEAVIIKIVFTDGIREESTENPTTDDVDYYEESTESSSTDHVDYYEYVNRSEINALPPKSTLVPLQLPVKRIIIAHTATPICTDFVNSNKIK